MESLDVVLEDPYKVPHKVPHEVPLIFPTDLPDHHLNPIQPSMPQMTLR